MARITVSAPMGYRRERKNDMTRIDRKPRDLSGHLASLAHLRYAWYCICGAMCRDDEEFCPDCARPRSGRTLWDARKDG